MTLGFKKVMRSYRYWNVDKYMDRIDPYKYEHKVVWQANTNEGIDMSSLTMIVEKAIGRIAGENDVIHISPDMNLGLESPVDDF
jgi:hypothetical protein